MLEEGFFARQRANAEARGSGFSWATGEPQSTSQLIASSSSLSGSGVQASSLMVPSVAPEPESEERDPLEELEEWLATSGQVTWT